MAVYAIGDVQGCFSALTALLAEIRFNAREDTLWFVGDLVNRGPDSLAVLRFIKGLGERTVCVLGNHDLHLLARAYGKVDAKPLDTLAPIMAAPDRVTLVEWLRQQPLFHHDEALGYSLIHAGIAPRWDLAQAQRCAHEVEAQLKGPAIEEFLTHLYGNQPDHWDARLQGWERLRAITNTLTRLRYCDVAGHMAWREKGAPGTQAPGLYPWFAVPGRVTWPSTILFGHWSALGLWSGAGTIGLDGGCVWGGRLSAVRLSDRQFFSVSCPKIASTTVDV